MTNQGCARTAKGRAGRARSGRAHGLGGTAVADAPARIMSDSATLRGSRYWVSGFPRLVAEWDRKRNGVLTPETVSAGSGRMIWWCCARGDEHQWRAKPNNRSRGAGCPFCTNRRVSRTNNLAACFPLVAAEWHPVRNGRTDPREVMAASTRICWWRCRAHPFHEWRTSIRDRTRGQTTCPFCSQRRVSPEHSLSERHPAIAAEWHPTRNEGLSPEDVTPGSARPVWWRCSVNAKHFWRTNVANRVRRASGCPRCPRRRLLERA
jgi:hypothetical protein